MTRKEFLQRAMLDYLSLVVHVHGDDRQSALERAQSHADDLERVIPFDDARAPAAPGAPLTNDQKTAAAMLSGELGRFARLELSDKIDARGIREALDDASALLLELSGDFVIRAGGEGRTVSSSILAARAKVKPLKADTKRELESIRGRLVELRDRSLMPDDFDAQLAIGLSHAIRDLHFAITGEDWKEAT